MQALVDQSVQERQNIEYKRQAYGRSDSETKEILKDISSMSNASGGYLFLGIREDDNNAGMPEEIVGIDNAEQERDRVLSSCLSSIEPRIPGLKAQVVNNEDSSLSVLTIFIPKSTRAPHMVTYKGHNKFWVRHDRQKSMMSTDEIGQAFLRTSNITQDVYQFIKERRSNLLQSIVGEPSIVMGATPLMVKDEIVDINDEQIRNLLSNAPNQRQNGWHLSFNGQPAKPTLNGLRVQDNDRTVELFRNGYFEMRIKKSRFIDETKQNDGTRLNYSIFKSYAIAEYPVSFFNLLKGLAGYLGLEGQFVVFLSLFYIKNFALPDDIDYLSNYIAWDEPHLELPPVQIALNQIADINAKFFVDRVWHAFEFDKCPFFNNAGNLGKD